MPDNDTATILQSPTTPVRGARVKVYGALAAAIVAVHAAVSWFARAPGVRTGVDDAIYLLLARSIRQLGYHDIFLVGSPVHRMYPPGYPGLLAVWGGVVGESFDALVLLNVLLSAVALVVVYRVAARLWSPALGLAVIAALAFNPELVRFAGAVFTETPYTALSLLALAALAGREPSRRTLVLAGALAVAAAMTRSVGATLLLAVGLHWLLERRWVPVLVLGSTSVATVGGWLLWGWLESTKEAGKSYIADAGFTGSDGGSLAGALLDRVIGNVPAYVTRSVPYRMPFPTIEGTPLDNAAGLLVLVLGVGIGWWVLLRRWRVAALYLAAYGLLLALWPWAVGRFVVPVLPLLVLALLVGIHAGLTRLRALPPRTALAAVAVASAVLAATGVSRTAVLARQNGCDRDAELPPPACVTRDQRSFFEAVAFARAELPEDAVVLTLKPATFYYYTGLLTSPTMALYSARPEDFRGILDRHGVDYVLLSSLHAAEVGVLPDLLDHECSRLSVVAAFPPRTYLFRVLAAPAADASACEAVEAYRAANVGRDFRNDPIGAARMRSGPAGGAVLGVQHVRTGHHTRRGGTAARRRMGADG